MEEEISELKKIFPFSLQNKINNEEWVAQQQMEVKMEIAQLAAYEQELKSEYEKLMKIYG